MCSFSFSLMITKNQKWKQTDKNESIQNSGASFVTCPDMWLTYLSWLQWRKLAFPLTEGFNWNSLMERGGTLCLLLLLHAWVMSGSYFCRSSLGGHSPCGFICSPALLIMKDIILGVICHLRHLSSFSFFLLHRSMIFEEDVIKTSHLEGNTQKSLTLYTLSYYGSLC